MKTLLRMFEHLTWANQRMLNILQNAEVEEQELRLFLHILNAEQVWVTRLQGMDSSQLPIWSDGDITVCAKLSEKNAENYTSFLANLVETDLDNLITYTTSRGEAFSTSIRDILTHVALHGQYHRGQISSRLRVSGIEPISTDYIIFAR